MAHGKKKKIHLQCRSHSFEPWVGKIPWRRKWQPTPVFLLGKSHGQRSVVAYSLWDSEESDTTERLNIKGKGVGRRGKETQSTGKEKPWKRP